MRYRVFGFIVCFIPVVTRDPGVGTEYGIDLKMIDDRGIFGRVLFLLFVGSRDVSPDLSVARDVQPFRQPFLSP